MSATKDTLAKVHKLLGEQMLLLLEHGRPVYKDGAITDWTPVTSQEMQAIIKFLDSNGIDTATPEQTKPGEGTKFDALMEEAKANAAKGLHLRMQ